MFRNTLAFAAMLISPTVLSAQGTSAVPDTTPKITFGGFVDGYYAFDFNRPANFDRSFTTQPARHNEFNVNLAYVEAKLDAPRARGRFAIQTGTSVQSNYAGEPRNGGVSGPDLARLIQEAIVGTKIGENAWVDGGIFLSHIGMESFISRDNPMYTRSLVADYSPYYETGAKLSWQAAPTVSATFVVVNGWQNISETNAAKSAGMRIDYVPSSSTTLSYYNYVGNEAADSAKHSQIRFFNGVGLKSSLTSQFTVLAQFDYGVQGHASGSGSSSWYGGMLTGRVQATPMTAIVCRVERYDDKDQVILATGLAAGFRANGASIGIDVTPQSRVLWRTELRGFQGENAVFPQHTGGPSKSDAFVVTSLGLTF
ncbi:MAG: outer membrane beta-barrel protein [Gemmatimonadota bacterium]